MCEHRVYQTFSASLSIFHGKPFLILYMPSNILGQIAPKMQYFAIKHILFFFF